MFDKTRHLLFPSNFNTDFLESPRKFSRSVIRSPTTDQKKRQVQTMRSLTVCPAFCSFAHAPPETLTGKHSPVIGFLSPDVIAIMITSQFSSFAKRSRWPEPTTFRRLPMVRMHRQLQRYLFPHPLQEASSLLHPKGPVRPGQAP